MRHGSTAPAAVAMAAILGLLAVSTPGGASVRVHAMQQRAGLESSPAAESTVAGGFVAVQRLTSTPGKPGPAAAIVTSRDQVNPTATASAPGRGVAASPLGDRGGTHLIFSFVDSVNPTATVAALPASVRGVSWLVGWKNIEPNAPVGGVHTYKWNLIDADLAAAAASGRLSMVRVIAGQLSPSWVQPTVTFTNTQPAQTVTMPVPWSTNFITNWTAFIAAYGLRYGGDPRIWAIEMAGAGRQGEMSIGDWTGWTSTAPPPNGMGSDPATDTKLITAWNTIIDAYRAAFPLKPSALDLGDPLGDGVIQPAVMSHAQAYGSLVFFQQNGLHSNLVGQYPGLLQGASATTTVGWQMIDGGNSASELEGSFIVAFGSHATYVEVYQADCVNPANAVALTYFTQAR